MNDYTAKSPGTSQDYPEETMMNLVKCLFTAMAILLLSAGPLSAEPAQQPSFVLGPGDILEISVWKDPDLTKQVIVQPDGYLSFPLIGQVLAGNRTLDEIRSDISERLKEYVSSPAVAVLPVRLESYKVYVLGKVNKPGVFVLPHEINVMQALSMGGGANPFADLEDISILRQGPEEQQKLSFNYKEVAKGKKLEQNIRLKSGDVVVVR